MNEYKTKEIRNIALLGHASTGKTSLSEVMLYTAGQTSRMGKIDEGTTVSDFTKEEIDRKSSISSSLMHAEWQNKKINIIDVPGYLDFIAETKAITRVVDIGLIVINCLEGIEVGSELAYRFAKEENLPLGIVINMLDKENADFDTALDAVQNVFGKNAVPVQIPVNQGLDYDSVIDVIGNKMYTFSKDGTGKATETDVPADMQDKVEELRESVIEYAAESDDELLEKYFDEGSLSDEELTLGLKQAILTGKLFPVFATSANNNTGVSNMMDLIVNYAPAPSDRGKIKGATHDGNELEREISENEPLSLFVFKTSAEQHVGEMYMFKVMSGVLHNGIDLANQTSNSNEKIGQIFCVNGKDKNDISTLNAGDLGAVLKLKKTHTVDTLCDSKSPIIYPEIDFPEPVVRVAVRPKSRADEDKITTGLQSLADEDPNFNFKFDSEVKQTILTGQGEVHLKVKLDKLKQRFNVEVEKLRPKIPYRETITKRGEAKFRHKKQSGGAGQFAEVWMNVEPLKSGEGVQFEATLVGQNVDRVFVPSVEKGVNAAVQEGIVIGCLVTDIKAVFFDGKMHPVDSKDIAFQIAGKGAFKECFANANPIILEPIYNLEVTVPEEYMGDVMGDISTRRGKVQGMDSDGTYQIVKAQVPLAELYQYGITLRSMTQGKGLHKQNFSHYEPVPHEIQEKVIEEHKQKKEDE